VKTILIFFVFFSFCVNAQLMRIGIFTGDKINRITFSYSESAYSIFGDTTYIGELNTNDYIDLTALENDSIRLVFGVIEFGRFSKIRLVQNTSNGFLTLTQKMTEIKPRKYVGDFEISRGKNGLCVVNCVNLDDYLAGVVESEGGVGHHLEYYKAQAVLSRTYAVRNFNRHKKDGFDLCDRVHCQAYHYKWRFSKTILDAVVQTKNEVLMDANGEFVEGYFHANCGGQTSESDYIWNEAIPYLKSFKDTFCIYTKQANWQKKILKSKWSKYFQDKYFVSNSDSLFNYQQFHFQQECRKAFFVHPKYGIPLRDIRDEFDLKSTFFSCEEEGEYVILKGKGYGHGVGLCQEGAMKMAKFSRKYDQILEYYFHESNIIRLESIINISKKDITVEQPVTFETFFENSKAE
jgi:stage II sporulation protein D